MSAIEQSENIAQTLYGANANRCAWMALNTTPILERPFWWSFRIITQQILEKNDKNYYQRIISTLLTFPLAPVSLLGASAALLTRFVTHYLEEGSFLYYRGKVGSLEQVKQFSLLTWNVCCMSGGLPILYGGVAPAQQRIQRIAEKILSADPDIICLQEMEDEACTLRLIELLSDKYHDFYFNIAPRRLVKSGSGLMVASKIRLQEPTFHLFKAATRAQKWANKGFFAFTFSMQDQHIHVINVHLQPSKIDQHPTPPEKSVRESQIQQILKKVAQTQKTTLHLVVGDFNIVSGSEEHQTSSIRQFEDLSAKISDATWIDYSEKKEVTHKLDYILAKGNFLNQNTQLIACFDVKNPQKALSDHQALSTCVSL